MKFQRSKTGLEGGVAGWVRSSIQQNRLVLIVVLVLVGAGIYGLWQQLAVARRSVDTAHTLFVQSERSRAAGIATTADHLQAELSYRTAQNTLADRRIAYAEALARYRALTE